LDQVLCNLAPSSISIESSVSSLSMCLPYTMYCPSPCIRTITTYQRRPSTLYSTLRLSRLHLSVPDTQNPLLSASKSSETPCHRHSSVDH
jgi:hypothetical protein